MSLRSLWGRSSVALIFSVVSGCAATPPTRIGADTYFAAKTNTAGAFGNPAAIAGSLMAEGNKFCAQQHKEFELVTDDIAPARIGSSLGGASITFRCVAHAGNPLMPRYNGVTTVITH